MKQHLFALGSLTLLSWTSGCTEDSTQLKENSLAEKPASGSFWTLYEPNGIDFFHQSGPPKSRLLPQSLGAGCIVADLDNDSDNDLYFLQGHDLEQVGQSTSGNALYWNDGQGNFELAPPTSGASDPGFGISGSVGDVDNDGDLDIYICNLGPNVLLLNNGDGTFQPAEKTGGAVDDGFSTGSTFFDADRDGDLDLYVTRYVDWSLELESECVNLLGGIDFCPPGHYNRPLEDRFFRNDSGTFIDQTEFSGLSGHLGHGLACAAGDVNGDGLDDIYVANDQMPNFLWINNGDNTFSEQAVQLGCATSNTGAARAGMSVTLIDIDHDLDFDIHVSNLEGESDGMFLNEGGQFLDHSSFTGLAGASRKMTRWGAVFNDWDLDGEIEMYTACGRVLQTNQSSDHSPYGELDLFLKFDRDGGRFKSLPVLDSPTNSRAVASGDLDGDLFPELIVTNAWSDPVFLKAHQAPPHDAFAVIEVLINGSHAIGATVEIQRQDDQIQRHRIHRDGGYAASHTPGILCSSPEFVKEVKVLWPNGEQVAIPGPLNSGLIQITK